MRPVAFLLSALLLLRSAPAPGAACCGGGFAAPALIAGDDRAQLTGSYLWSQVSADVGTDSLWRRRRTEERTETLKLDAAHIFADRWQAGLSFPLIRRSRSGASSAGLGDLAASLGYELLTDWDYNPWRPRAISYLQLTVPTGRYVNEAEAPFQLDARGRGFWAAGLGTLFTKALAPWDFHASFDAHRSFAKDFRTAQAQGRASPGWGGNMGAGLGFSLSAWRLGGALSWSYEDPVAVSGTVEEKGAAQRLTTAQLALSRLFPGDWAGTLQYTDQTLFGSPINTSLSRGAALLVQKRWLR